MSTVLFISAVICGAGTAYFTTFAGATLAFGRALSSAGTKTGFQDAITPPWVGQFTLLAYAATIAVIAESWWLLGTFRVCVTMFIFVASLFCFRQLLPKENAFHYKAIIFRSMVSRYANYIRDNDMVRAAAMKALLDKAGIPVDYASPLTDKPT